VKRTLCNLYASAMKRLDWALLLIPLIALVAVWPFMTQSLPSTDDGALHLFRLVELDRCLRHGVLCLRWAPDFAHGYGYPGFNFYMNLPTIIAESIHLLGLDFPQAMAAAIVLAFFVSGWGAYLLGRDMGGWKAGLVVSTAYMYAPYQFFDAAYRGNLPELWGLAFLPWVLWTGRRAAVRRRWRDVVPFAIVYAALVWSHNIMTLLGSPILGLYLLNLWWQRGHAWREAWRMAAMVGLGLALSAFFWLPAYFEQVWTRYSPELFDYGVAFLSLKEMLAWPPQLDLDLLNPYPPRSQSWGMLLLIALGIVLAVRKAIAARRAKRTGVSAVEDEDGGLRRGTLVEWAFFGLAFLVASSLPLSALAFLWRAMTPLQIVQMPWRFLSVAALAGSVFAGWAITHLPDRRSLCSPALLATGGAIVLLVATSIPWTYAAPFPQPQNAGVADVVRWEYGTGLIGGTSASEFLPIWAPGVPTEPADPALLTEHDPIIARLDETSLPEGATIVSAKYGLMRADLVIDTPQAFRAWYKQFYFPGWQVRIDGEPVPLIATTPYGLLGFDVPAGKRHIVVRPATTPLRTAGAILSALGAVAAVGIVVLEQRGAPSVSTRRLPHGEEQVPPSRRGRTRREILALAILALLVLAAKEGIVDRTENLFRAHRFDGTRVPGVQTEAQVNFGDVLTLHGYDLPGKAVPSGDPLRIDLYLSARQPVDGDYRAYARLVDEEDRLWSLRDNGTPREFRPPPPTTVWPSGAYGHWAYLAYVLPGTPPGEYWIEVGLFEPGTWRGLNVLDEAGHIVGLSTRVGPVQIVRPRRPPDLDALDVERRLDTAVTPALRCLGSTFSTGSAQAGETVDITLFWQATQRPTTDYTLQLSLVSDKERFILASDLPLGRRAHLPTSWEEGEVVRSPHRLRVPAAVPSGSYAVEGTALDRQGFPVARPIALGKFDVLPTERLFSIPDGIERRVDANLEHRIALLGYGLGRAQAGWVSAGESLSITLYWQALREMDISYKASVQLVGVGGVLTQVDAVPVAWTRPTTGWMAGEMLVDEYVLSIPADARGGTYQLIAGMYNEGTLQRLAVLGPSGEVTGDHVLLQQIEVRQRNP
jgi:hypothetical protein